MLKYSTAHGMHQTNPLLRHLCRIAAAFGITQPVIHPLDSETCELHGSDDEVNFQIIVVPYMTVIQVVSSEEIVENDLGFCDEGVLTPNRYSPNNSREQTVYQHAHRIQVAAFKLGHAFKESDRLGLEPIIGHSAMEHTLLFNEDLEVVQQQMTTL